MHHHLKDHDVKQRKTHYATHFGPEPEDESITKNRKKQVVTSYKDQLLQQIKSNEEEQKHKVILERAFENIVVDSNNHRLQEEERLKVVKVKDQQKVCREAWEHQMKVNQEKKAGVVLA